MITEDKVNEIFCIADDFCKVFDAQMAKYTFKAERKRKYHHESRTSKAEIMVTIRCAKLFLQIFTPIYYYACARAVLTLPRCGSGSAARHVYLNGNE